LAANAILATISLKSQEDWYSESHEPAETIQAKSLALDASPNPPCRTEAVG
jgi:hypothetical protein